MGNRKIFIQIASYRDPQLIHTIRDCDMKASDPSKLVYSISWQHSQEDEWDQLHEFKGDPRFKVVDIDYKDSKGACWARNQLQQNYDGEEYTLQIDSHHRFVQDWDLELISMYNQLKEKGHEKPLLTGYVSSFDPENDPAGRIQTPWKMNFDRFIPEGAIFESADPSLNPEFTCAIATTSDGKSIIACTGKQLYSYKLKVCVPPVVTNDDLGKCTADGIFDPANQCCVAPPPDGAGCTIFKVDLRSCK